MVGPVSKNTHLPTHLPAGRVLTFVYMSLFIGLIFFDIPGGVDGLATRFNILFANACFFLLMPFVSISLFTSDKRFFLADSAAKLYHPMLYYIAKVRSKQGQIEFWARTFIPPLKRQMAGHNVPNSLVAC